ncbi:MAG TPA: hypothetical protein VF265_04690, partial [Nevskiaceae bacterium]
MRDQRRRTVATAGHSVLRGFASIVGAALLMVGTAQAAVTIDQVPLTVRKPLAPNIVLMLDNSGSMAWNFMPDFSYLNGVVTSKTKATVNNDALIDAQNNGVYYDPTVLYTPPPKDDSSKESPDRYQNSPGLTKAWPDGFGNVAVTVDLTQYANAQANGAGTDSNGYPHYTAVYDTDSYVTDGYSNVAMSTLQPAGSYPPSCDTGDSLNTTGSRAGQCSHVNRGRTTYYSACRSGDSYRSGNPGVCVTNYAFFQYSTGPAEG